MTEEQEHAQGARADAQEQAESEPEPFDQNPPVDPGEPQVGNSRARFFMPREEGEGEGDDEEEADEEEADEQEVREGDA